MGGLNSGPGPGITLLIAIVVVLTQTALAAPVHEDEEAQENNSHALAESHGCYYNFQHYNEGERILTNEPCLNCTCRNRMLMCYLRVCPFTKGIGQNCTVEKVPGQCCPIITCPEVPVQLLTSTTTEHSEGGKAPSNYYGNKGTAVGHLDTNGCNIDGIFYPNGAQVPNSPEKPCELCYCIRNKTACIIQECALHVDGCRPVYEEGQCFPVRYQCDDSPYEEEPTTTIRPAPTPGLIITTTSSEPLECSYNNDIYDDGSKIPTEDPCEYCYCLKGKIACAVQECGAPLEKDGQNCTALPPAPGKCCPDSYQCDNNVIVHAKENFVRKDRKQKFEPKPIEHNDITMTSQGLSSGSEETTQSGIPSVADAGHPTDGYHPHRVTTEKPNLTTIRFDEESKVTEGITPAKGIAGPSVTSEHQELDKGTQQEKDSQPEKPIGDQKITFPDKLKPEKGGATVLDDTNGQIIHMSAEKQPHPDIESHKQSVTPQTATNDILSESSTPGVKDPLIDKLHNIIQDVQSQVGDGKPSQMPEEVDMQTTTQSQKGHFTEKPDVLSHLPQSSTPSAEITNATKESSPEDTNILNQIHGIIQGIYSHVTDSIMSTKQPESTTEVGQLTGQELSVSEKEGVAGSYPGQHPEIIKHPIYPHEVTERPKTPAAINYPEGATDHPSIYKPHASTKYPQKLGSHEESYGTQYPDEIGAAEKPEGTTKYPETEFDTQYPEGVSGRPKDPSKYPEGQNLHVHPTGQYPESVEIPGKPYDPSKYPEEVKPDHHISSVTVRPDDQTKNPEQYQIDSKYPQAYKPGQSPDSSKFPEGESSKPKDHTKYPDGQYPDSVRPTEYYPELSKLTDKPYEPYNFSKYPSEQYPGVKPSAQQPEEFAPTDEYPEVTGEPNNSSEYPDRHHPGIKPIGEHSDFTGVTGKPQYNSKYPETVTGQSPQDYKYPGIRPDGEYQESEKPHDQKQYPEPGKPFDKYPNGEYPESVTERPEDQTQYPQGNKPTGHYTSGSQYPEAVEVGKKPQDGQKYSEGAKSTEKYPFETKYPDGVNSKPEDNVNYQDNVKPSDEHLTGQYPDAVTTKPEEYTKYPESVTSRPDQTSHPHETFGKYPVDSKLPEELHSFGEQLEFKPTGEYPETATAQPDEKNKYPNKDYPESSVYPKKPEDTAYGSAYLDSEGKPKDPIEHEDGVRPIGQKPEGFKPTEWHPKNVTAKPDYQTKHPALEEHQLSGYYPENVHSNVPKYPHNDTPSSEDEAYGTKYPEGVTGKPLYNKFPTKPGHPNRPIEQSQDTKYTGGDKTTEQYPEGVTGRPEDPTKYPGQRPGVFRPTGEYTEDSEHPEAGTEKPEHSILYPHGYGTEKPERETGKPEGTTYYPEGEKIYETVSSGVDGRPEDPSKYPGARPTGVTTEQPGESTKYPDDLKPGIKPNEKYPHKPEDGTEYPEFGVTEKRKGEHSEVKPIGQYPTDSKHSEGVSLRPSGSTEHPDKFRPTGHYPEDVNGASHDLIKYPENAKPTGQISDNFEGFSKQPDVVPKIPEDQTQYPEVTTDDYSIDSQYPAEIKPSYPDAQDHTKRPQTPDDNIHGTEYPDSTGKPDSIIEGVDKYPGESSHGTNSQPTDIESNKPLGSNFADSSYATENPKKAISTEYPKGAKPSRPYKKPGLQDEPIGTEYPETTHREFESEYGTEYPESATKYSVPSYYQTKRPITGDKHQQQAVEENETGTEYFEGTTVHSESDSYPVVSRRPGLKPGSAVESVPDIPEGLKPSSSGHYPSGPSLTEQPHKKPEADSNGIEHSEADIYTERPHYTSKYPEKPSAEDQHLGTERPDSKITSHPTGADHPTEGKGKYPAEDVKQPIEGLTESSYHTSKHPSRPGHPQDVILPTKDTEYSAGSVTDKYPEKSEGPLGPNIVSEEENIYPGSEDEENKYLDSKTGKPTDYPSKADQTHGTDSLGPSQTKYPDNIKPDYKIPHKPESDAEYPQTGVTDYPKGQPQHLNKYPEGSESLSDKTEAQTPEGIIGHYPHGTGKPLSQHPGTEYFENVTGQPEYPEGFKEPDQSPSKTTNTTKESSLDESNNILNQIQGIIQGIYSQVTDSILSTIRPESATMVGQEGGKPQESDHDFHTGQTGVEHTLATEFPNGAEHLVHPGRVTETPHISSKYPGTEDKNLEGVATHPDKFRPIGTLSTSTKYPQSTEFDKEAYSTQYPDRTEPTGGPEGFIDYTNGDGAYGTEHSHVSGKPKEPTKITEEIKFGQQFDGFKPAEPNQIGAKYPDKVTKKPYHQTKFPDEVTGYHPIDSEHPHGSRPGSYQGGSKYPEGMTGKPEDHTEYSEEITSHHPSGSNYPELIGETYKPQVSKISEVQPTGKYPSEVTERPEDQTKSSDKVRPTEQYQIDSERPEDTEYPDINNRPKDPSKYPEGQSFEEHKSGPQTHGTEPTSQVDSKYPSGISEKPGVRPEEYLEGTTKQPQYFTKIPEVDAEYFEASSRPMDQTKYPSKYPQKPRPAGSQEPSYNTEYPDITDRPDGTDDLGATSKYPQKQKPEMSEVYGTDSSGASIHRPGLYSPVSKRPATEPGAEYPEEYTGKPEPHENKPQSTAYPAESKYSSSTRKPLPVTEDLTEISGKPHSSTEYPTRPKPEYEEPYGTEHPETTVSEYTEIKPYKPSKHANDTVYGVKYPENVHSNIPKYPHSDTPSSEDEAYGTKYPEGVTGKPFYNKFPTKPGHPNRPIEQSQDTKYTGGDKTTEQYPEGVTDRPEDPTKYPGQRPGVFRPTGEYTEDSEHPEAGTEKPEHSILYPHGYGTEKPERETGKPEGTTYYPEGEKIYETVSSGVDGRPKDPSKYPGARPTGVTTEQPGESTKYPDDLKPGFKPNEKYPHKPEDGTEYPEFGVTEKRKGEHSEVKPIGQYPTDSKHSEGVSLRPSGSTEHPDKFRPTGHYPEDVNGTSHDFTKYPESFKPTEEYLGGFKPTEIYAVDTKQPSGVTDKPKDNSKVTEGMKPSEEYSEGHSYTTQYPDDSKPKEITKGPGSKYPDKAASKPEGSTKYSEGSKPSGEYSEGYKPTENILSGVTGKPDDLTIYPDVKPSDKYTPVLASSTEHLGEFEPTKTFSDTSRPVGKPGSQTEHPGAKPSVQDPETVKPSGQYSHGSKRPSESDYGTEYPENSTKNPEEFVTEYPEIVSEKPEDSSKYPVGVQLPESYKPTEEYPDIVIITSKPYDPSKPAESQYPGVKPDKLKPTKPSSVSKYPENVTDKSENQTKFPDIMLGRPEGPTHSPEGDSYVTEHHALSSTPKDSSKHPEQITAKPEEHTQHPNKTEPSGYYPDDSESSEESGVIEKLNDMNKYPGAKPIEEYEVDSKNPEGFKPPEQTSKDQLLQEHSDRFKPTEEYPQEITGKPEDQSKYPERIRPTLQYPVNSKYPEKVKPSQQYPESVTGRPESTTYFPEEDYGTEYPGMSGKPRDPSTHLEEFKPEKHPDGSKPAAEHPGLVSTGLYPHDVTVKPGNHTEYPEGFRPLGEDSEGLKPEEKYPQTPDDKSGTEYSHSVTEEYSGTTTRPHYSTKYPGENKPHDEGITERPVYETDYIENVKPTAQFPEGFTPTGQYPMNSEHSAEVTDKINESSKYPEGVKPSEQFPETSQPSDSKYPNEKPEDLIKHPENTKPNIYYPDGPKHPGGVTEGGVTQVYTKYPEGMTQNYPVGSQDAEGIKPSSQYPESNEVTGKPHNINEYPDGQSHELSKYPEISKPSTEYPYEQKPNEEHSDGVTGKPENVTYYLEGDSHVTEHPGASNRPKETTKYPEKVKPGQHHEKFEPTGQYPIDAKHPERITGEPEEHTKYPEGVKPIGHYPELSEYSDISGITGKPQDESKHPGGGIEENPVDVKLPVKVTEKPVVSKHPGHSTESYPNGIALKPEAVKPEQQPNKTENEFETEFPNTEFTHRPEHQTEITEGLTGQYPGVTGRPQYVTKYPEDDSHTVTPALEQHYQKGSKDPNRPDDYITSPENFKPSEGSEPFENQPELGLSEQYPDEVTKKPHDSTKYPGETIRPEYITIYPGGYQKESSKYPAKPESTSESTEYPEVTNKYPEGFGTEYPDGTKPTSQIDSKYPEKPTGKPIKRPLHKPSEEPGHTTMLPMDLEEASVPEIEVDLIEYSKKPKPEQESEEYLTTTFRPVQKYTMKYPQRPEGLGDEITGTEYPELNTEIGYEFGTRIPDVTGQHSEDNKPGETKPTKPGTEYLPHKGEKPSLQTSGLDENSLPSKETQTNNTGITNGLEQGKPIDESKPSPVDYYPLRPGPRPTIPGEGLYNEDLTNSPLEQSTSGTEVHPTVELTPDIKIPDGDFVTGQPEKYPSTEKPLESISNKPVDGFMEQLGANRHPETTPDDDLINKLHNIISGIQSQTTISSEHLTFSPQGAEEFSRPVSTHKTETYSTTKGVFVTERPQYGFESNPTEENVQHSHSPRPLPGHPSQSLSTEDPKVSSAQSSKPAESDKIGPHLPTENAFHTVTPQDGAQKQTSTDKPLHVVYPTYYPDGVVTRKPSAKPDDGDKKITVTPQSAYEKVPERGVTPTIYDVQTEISSEISTTPGVVIVEEVHTEIHSERPTRRPILGPAITQPGSSDLTTYSGYQTEVPETTKPFYVTVTPMGTNTESDHIMHLYSPKEKHPLTDIPTTQSFVTDLAVQNTRFPSRKTTQTPIDELTTQKPQGASYVPYKLVNFTKIYYPEKEMPQKPFESGPYDGYDHIHYEVVNGTKFFYPNRVATEQPTISANLGMYVPYKMINGTKVYYTQDPPQEPEKYDGLDYVPFEIKNGTKVFYPERVSTTPSPTTAMYVPFKTVNGKKVYYSKDAKDEPQDIPDEYDGFDYVPFETVNGKKVFHPERVPNHTPAGSDYVPYKLMNSSKIYYPKDAQNEGEKIPEEYDGFDSVPYDIIDNGKVYYPMKATPQKPSAMFVPYKLVNGTKVYYPKHGQDKPSPPLKGFDGFEYIPYDTVNGTKVFHPEKITSKPAYYPNKMFVPYKIINNTKLFYPKDAQHKPRPLKPEYDGIEYLPYDVVNGTKVFHTSGAPTSAMYVPYVIKNGEKIYDLKKATEDPKGVPEAYDGVDYLPYEVKNGSMVFYPEKIATPELKYAMYVPYKLINGTKIYYADKAADQPGDITKEYDGFDYLPFEVQNGNKIFYTDKVATHTIPTTVRPALYVPYKLINGKKVYDSNKATENPQDIPEEFDGFDYVPFDVKNGNKVFYPERVTPVPKEGAMYVPYKLINGTKVYYADKAVDKPEDVPNDYDGFNYIPYELQNGNKIFYPDRVATPTTKKAMYVPYKLENGKKIYLTNKATDNPQGILENFDGFDYVPYDIESGNKVFYPEKVIPTKGSEYVPYKIVKGIKVYHPEKAADKTQEVPEEFDGFDYLPFETQNGNKIFYPDRVTQAPKGAIYVPYKIVNGKKVYNPNKATNNPEDIPKGYDGCDYIPYEIKNGNKVFYPEQTTTPAPTQGSMYVPYKMINGSKIYYADKATDKQDNVSGEYDGFDYLPYELQNGNKIFYPDKANTLAPSKAFKYVPYKLVNGRKVYYPDRAADKPEDIPKNYDGFDYLPIEYTSKPQNSQGMFVPYKTINGTKIYYPQEAHKRPHPLSDEYSGLDYMPYETVNGTKIFYPEREPQAMYVPYKIINDTKAFYPKDAQRNPEEIPAGYDGLDYVPYDIVNGSQIFHFDRVPEYQGMFVPYKIVNGKKVFYPNYAQHKPMVMDGYDGFDYLPYENVNGMKVFKPEIPEEAMYVPYKVVNGTKVYYPKFAQRKPEVPVGYDGSDYIPYQLVNGTKIFNPSIKPAMYVPYKIIDGTKVYYPKHAQHKPENIPSGYDGHERLPYEVINGNKVFKPGQGTPQEQVTPQIKQEMYVPYKIINGTKVYYPKYAQNKPEYIPDGYDGHDYLPYEIVNGNKVFKPEQVTPQIKQAMYVPYKIVNGTKVYHPKYAQHNPYLIQPGYDGSDYVPYEIVNGSKIFRPEQATTTPQPPKQAMYVPFKFVNGTKAYYPKHAQHTPTPVPSNYDGLDYLPYEVVNGTKVFDPQPHTKPTYLLGMFVPYKLSNNTKIFYPKDAHNKPHYVPQGYDGADYVPYEAVNNTKLFYPELISMAQPSTANIPGIYVPFRLVNNKKVFYPKEGTPFPPTVRYPYDGVAFVPYKSSVPSEIIYVDEDDLTKPHILSGHVPGEGNCYLNNTTYTNNTEVAPVSPCQAKCTCISSVVRCVRVKCPLPPQNKLDCSPVYREGICCPTYSCGESEYEYPTTVGYSDTKAPEGTSHGHDSESTTAFTDLTSQKKKPGSGEEVKPGQQSEEYHLHKPPKPSEHESLEPYDSVEGQLSPEEDYDVEDEEPYGPGTCRYAGKVYVSAQQIPRDDPCDFCFCFRSDIICLQQSCPPPIPGCRDEPIEGFCCPRYECHVKMATLLNVTSTTTTTTTTLPPHFFPHAYKGSATKTGCFVQGKAYRVGQPIPSASGPCMDCICGGNGRMKCEPKVCTPEPMIRKMMSPSESTTTSTNKR